MRSVFCEERECVCVRSVEFGVCMYVCGVLVCVCECAPWCVFALCVRVAFVCGMLWVCVESS